MAEPDVFVVEKLMGERYYGTGAKRRKQFLVRWEGFGDAENTWEDEEHILDDDLIDSYKQSKRKALEEKRAQQEASGEAPSQLEEGEEAQQ